MSIALNPYIDLSGTGGLYSAGRWNSLGRAVVYTSGTRSLAMLERYIHERADNKPLDLVMLSIHIPDEMEIKHISSHKLAENWYFDSDLTQLHTQIIGDTWLGEQSSAVLKVPSTIVPQEYNYLINPMCKLSDQIIVVDQRPYQYDSRYSGLMK